MWILGFKSFLLGFSVARLPKLPNDNEPFPAQTQKVSFLPRDLTSLLLLEKGKGRWQITNTRVSCEKKSSEQDGSYERENRLEIFNETKGIWLNQPLMEAGREGGPRERAGS